MKERKKGLEGRVIKVKVEDKKGRKEWTKEKCEWDRER